MNVNYLNTLIAGIAVSVFIGGMQFLGCCCWPVDLALLIAAGALAVHLSAVSIMTRDDALVTGGLAGFIGGLGGGILYAIMGLIMNLLFGTLSFFSTEDPESVIAGTSIFTFFSGLSTIVCCLPTFVVAGIAMGALGGLLYVKIRK
ncbi:hypothetical protein [Methanocella arvoryzae]|uniref:DUF5518 domain-containing protein n=1 Tax=Methanocella arvoryzae (strain DSM 22066 / NBRC 105507 / MRE50) TaxID=351160 RepID=Q0W716_METAR|nr:hypothetical protein [Methanocella arvoryzae]CAJ35827.1 hypothetical protein RCIX384 [Methanocella arvoryzae MRE50]